MIDPLDYLWPLADARTSTVPEHIYSTWPAGMADRLLELGWLADFETSDRVLCPECGDHFEEVVIRPGIGGAVRSFIPCRRHIRVMVRPNARRRLGVHFDRLVAEIAAALQLTGTVKTLIAQRVWRLGRLLWRGETRDIVFARGFAWDDATSVRRVIVAARQPIVLVPQAMPAPDYWRGRMPPVIALDQASFLDGFGIVFDPLVFASAVQDVDSSAADSEHRTIDCDQLKLIIRRQIKAEHKTQLTDDVYLAARRQCGSVRKAAEYLSQETGQTVTKDQVFQAVKRSGGLAEIINAADSDSIVRTSATARGRRKSKPCSSHK